MYVLRHCQDCVIYLKFFLLGIVAVLTVGLLPMYVCEFVTSRPSSSRNGSKSKSWTDVLNIDCTRKCWH